MLKNIIGRLRGIVGSAVTWAGGWFLGGLAFFFSLGLFVTIRRSRLEIWGDPDTWLGLLEMAGSSAVVGATTGGVFATYIVATSKNKRLQDLSPVRFAVGGGLVAVLLKLLLVSADTLGRGYEFRHIVLDPLIPSLAFLGLAGAATGFVSLKMAQRGQVGATEEADRVEASSMPPLPKPTSESV
jgi:hypothetical protein